MIEVSLAPSGQPQGPSGVFRLEQSFAVAGHSSPIREVIVRRWRLVYFYPLPCGRGSLIH